ncbi:hypothetical protein KC878_02375 [Candidatus Saccharibacteria bacterium]|nr:hypothetical protein [Candidatus Saccharibacteria bacterium]MCB9821345.1 hypothetical protein [Candidatus Nomurabacteria bacterium]
MIPEKRPGAQQLNIHQIIDWVLSDCCLNTASAGLLIDLVSDRYDPDAKANQYPEGFRRVADWFLAGAIAALGESPETVEFARAERVRQVLRKVSVELGPDSDLARTLYAANV